MADDLVQNINPSDFDEKVLRSDLPVLVDFGATWCGPCKVVEKAIHEIAPEFKGRVRFIKVDVDTAPQIAMSYSILSVPTLLFFKGGKVTGQRSSLTKDKLRAFIESSI